MEICELRTRDRRVSTTRALDGVAWRGGQGRTGRVFWGARPRRFFIPHPGNLHVQETDRFKFIKIERGDRGYAIHDAPEI